MSQGQAGGFVDKYTLPVRAPMRELTGHAFGNPTQPAGVRPAKRTQTGYAAHKLLPSLSCLWRLVDRAGDMLGMSAGPRGSP